MRHAHSFCKWLGGKTKLLLHILPLLPESINTYFEPFLGGGAVFFALAKGKRYTDAILGDMNPDLINAYQVIKSNPKELIQELTNGKYIYDRSIYLGIRSEHMRINPIERAARFIYLNKTGFNGLYRVNKKGEFNVPFGKFTDPLVCDEGNILAVSETLRHVQIANVTFSETTKLARSGDAVFMDPPYYPISNTSNFTRYTNNGFEYEDHVNLASEFARLANLGASVILSNSLCDVTRELYKDYRIIELNGTRNVGGPASSRKSVTEILVVANVL